MKITTRIGLGAALAGVLACGCSLGFDNITYYGPDGSTGGGGSGATGGGASTSSTGGGGTGGGPVSCPHSDEFDGSSPDACWKTLDPTLFASLAVDGAQGMLVATPKDQAQNGWFQNAHGPLLYQEVTGDFILVARVFATQANDLGMPPFKLYNTAGLLARDPASVNTNENWVLYDIGQQGNSTDTPVVTVGTMAKGTIHSGTMKFPESGTHSGLLAICRIGGSFEVLKRLYNPDGDFLSAHTFQWNEAPATLQVGLTVGSWVTAPDVVGRFDYARLGDPHQHGTCLEAFQAISNAP